MVAWMESTGHTWSTVRPFSTNLSLAPVSKSAGRDEGKRSPRRPASERTRRNSEQAHVPAEQSAPSEDAWLPAAHAHPGWPGRARGAQAQGPREAECLILPPPYRLRRSADFKRTVREGVRAGRPTVVGHLLLVSGDEPARVGFVVSRAVGSAVTRNRVKRRLRELTRGYLQSLPGGSLLVLRANPIAGRARQPDLAADLDLVIHRLLRRQVGQS